MIRLGKWQTKPSYLCILGDIWPAEWIPSFSTDPASGSVWTWLLPVIFLVPGEMSNKLTHSVPERSAFCRLFPLKGATPCSLPWFKWLKSGIRSRTNCRFGWWNWINWINQLPLTEPFFCRKKWGKLLTVEASLKGTTSVSWRSHPVIHDDWMIWGTLWHSHDSV